MALAKGDDPESFTEIVRHDSPLPEKMTLKSSASPVRSHYFQNPLNLLIHIESVPIDGEMTVSPLRCLPGIEEGLQGFQRIIRLNERSCPLIASAASQPFSDPLRQEPWPSGDPRVFRPRFDLFHQRSLPTNLTIFRRSSMSLKNRSGFND